MRAPLPAPAPSRRTAWRAAWLAATLLLPLLALGACSESGGGGPSSVDLQVTVQGDGAVFVDDVQRAAPFRQSFAAGTSVSLAAIASEGAEFDGWTGAVTTAQNPLTILMNVPRDVTAVFVTSQATKSVTVQRAGAGSGAVSSQPAGIACGDACQASFAKDASVTLTAEADAFSTFEGWTGCDATDGPTCTVEGDDDRTIEAEFAATGVEPRSITVQRTGTGTGVVFSSPTGIDCGEDCQADFPEDTEVTLTAEADAFSTFAGWTGCDATDGPTCTVEGDDDRAIEAEFTTAAPAPSNDDFADADVLEGPSGTESVSNAGASKEPGEPNHGGDTGGRSLWWTWTAGMDGPVTFDASGSAIDVVLAVYTGSAVDDLDEVGSPGFLSTSATAVTVDATDGATYRIAVDGVGGATGDIRLDWDQTPPAAEVDWTLSPTQLSFVGTRGGPAPAAQATQLTNGGPDAGSFGVSDSRSWLDASPSSGALDPGASTTLTVAVDACTGAGTSTGTVTVAGHDVTATVSVERICDGADWQTVPDDLDFSGEVGESAPPDQDVLLENDGTISASYTVASNRAWLTVSPDNGTLGVGADETLTVGVDACDSEGTSSGALTIEGGGHVRTVPVTRSCTDPSAEPPVALSIDRVYVNQSVPAQDTSVGAASRVPLVANRGGLLRVFATADDTGAGQASVTLHYRYDGGSESTLSLNGPTSVPTSTSESSRASVYERLLTSGLVQPGLEAYVTVEAVAGGTPVAARYPSSGYWSLEVETVPAANMTIVPVTYAGGTPSVGDGSAYLTFTERLYPMGDDTVDVQVRSPYAFGGSLSSGQGWVSLLNELTTLWQSDGTSRHYFGVVDPNYTSGIAGIGWVGYRPVAVGWSYLPSGSEVAAHELGHNWGREHAPCGVSDSDPSYPYGGADIGTWGYDLVADALRSPSQYVDLMSYCDPVWVSDYTYEGIMDYRRANGYTVETAGAPQRVLVVSGAVGPDGIDLDPLLTLTGRPATVPEGPYTITVWDAEGRPVAEVPFDARHVSVHPYEAFHLTLALPDGVVSLSRVRIERDGQVLVERTAPLTAAATEPPSIEALGDGRVAVEWDATAYRTALLRDGIDGPLLGRSDAGRLIVQPTGRTLELLLSDGVNTHRVVLSF